MIRGTTPTLRLALDSDIDLTDDKVYVGIRDVFSGTEYLFSSDDENVTVSYAQGHTVIRVALTQEQTLKLSGDKTAAIQVKWVEESGYTGGTDTIEIDVEDTIIEEVIEYGGE